MTEDDQSLRRIVACRILDDSGVIVHLRVYCPRVDGSVPVSECETCADEVALPAGPDDEGFVRCGLAGAGACAKVGEAPPIGALVSTPVRAVRDSASLAIALEALAAAGAEPVLVVDAAGAVVGSLSRTEMLVRVPRATLPGEDGNATRGHAPRPVAHDLMTEATIATETSSVRDVLRTMATRKLRAIAVASAEGVPLGIVSDVEALRFFAGVRG